MLLRALDLLKRIETWAAGTLAAFALFAALYQVITRYAFPEYAGEWSDELQVYALIWAILLISATVADESGHVRVDLFVNQLPPRARRYVECFNSLLAFSFCALLSYYGAVVAFDALRWHELSPSGLKFPMWIYFACLPVGTLLMSIRYLRRCFHLLTKQADPRAGNPEAEHV